MLRNKISITGEIGSGKTTVAIALSKKMDMEYFSTGNFQRELAKQYGVNTLELNYIANKDTKIDATIDGKLIEINKQDLPYVLDSRLAWHFVPNSFKVYLQVEPEIAATRILGDFMRTSDPHQKNKEEIIVNINERRRVEEERFQKVYHVHCHDYNNYDLVINTGEMSVSEITDTIVDSYNLWKEGIYEKNYS